jgi:hypothetical protein
VLAGRVLDPLVGRHVLTGACVAIISAVLDLIHHDLTDHAAVPIFLLSALEALRSSAAFGGMVVAAFLNGVVTSLFTVAVLVLFRLIVGRTWLGAMALVALAVPIVAHGTSALEVVLATLMAILSLTVLLRVGVVAHMAMLVVTGLLTWLPLTLDTDAWYFGQSLLVLLLIVGLGTYGFLVALGDRPVFGVMEAT